MEDKKDLKKEEKIEEKMEPLIYILSMMLLQQKIRLKY